jgi:hypothetical protein
VTAQVRDALATSRALGVRATATGEGLAS